MRGEEGKKDKGEETVRDGRKEEGKGEGKGRKKKRGRKEEGKGRWCVCVFNSLSCLITNSFKSSNISYYILSACQMFANFP